MDPTYVKQLMLAKYLFRQGEKTLDMHSPMSCGVAISHLQDAVEMFLWTAVKEKSLGNLRQEQSFAALWKLVDEHVQPNKLPYQARMGDLNNARVNFKHYGNLADPSDAEKFLPYTREFLVEATKMIFGTDFEALSLVDLIEDRRVRDRLKQAEGHLANGELDACMADCAEAEYHISAVLRTIFPRVKATMSCMLEKPDYTKGPLFGNMTDYLNTLRDLVFVAVLSIQTSDFFRYDTLRSTMPIVSEFPDGRIQAGHRVTSYNEEDAPFIIRYLTDYALAVQQHVKPTGQVSPAQKT